MDIEGDGIGGRMSAQDGCSLRILIDDGEMFLEMRV